MGQKEDIDFNLKLPEGFSFDFHVKPDTVGPTPAEPAKPKKLRRDGRSYPLDHTSRPPAAEHSDVSDEAAGLSKSERVLYGNMATPELKERLAANLAATLVANPEASLKELVELLPGIDMERLKIDPNAAVTFPDPSMEDVSLQDLLNPLPLDLKKEDYAELARLLHEYATMPANELNTDLEAVLNPLEVQTTIEGTSMPKPKIITAQPAAPVLVRSDKTSAAPAATPVDTTTTEVVSDAAAEAREENKRKWYYLWIW